MGTKLIKERNYARFFAAIKGTKVDRKALVYEYTDMRTDSLKELSDSEYDTLCRAMEDAHGLVAKLKAARSKVLRQMTSMGVDTSDWNRVDALCIDKRMAGTAFRHMGIKELDALCVKLRAIDRKGGLRRRESKPVVQVYSIYRSEITN